MAYSRWDTVCYHVCNPWGRREILEQNYDNTGPDMKTRSRQWQNSDGAFYYRTAFTIKTTQPANKTKRSKLDLLIKCVRVSAQMENTRPSGFTRKSDFSIILIQMNFHSLGWQQRLYKAVRAHAGPFIPMCEKGQTTWGTTKWELKASATLSNRTEVHMPRQLTWIKQHSNYRSLFFLISVFSFSFWKMKMWFLSDGFCWHKKTYSVSLNISWIITFDQMNTLMSRAEMEIYIHSL